MNYDYYLIGLFHKRMDERENLYKVPRISKSDTRVL